MTETTANRRRYETIRLAQWAIIDAITAASCIASRGADCLEGDDSFAAFNSLRDAIDALADSPEMRAVKTETQRAREELNQ